MFTNFADINGATENDKMPKVGDFVKAVFLSKGDRGEGMWIKVTKDNGDKSFEGELDNDPFYTPLEAGAKVSFNWRHIREVVGVEVVDK